MKTFKQLQEEIAMSVGSGNIAGLEPDTPPVPKGVTTSGAMFRRKPVFKLNSKNYLKVAKKGGKIPRRSYKSYSEDIANYAKENKGSEIIVQDETTGAMTFLRRGK